MKFRAPPRRAAWIGFGLGLIAALLACGRASRSPNDEVEWSERERDRVLTSRDGAVQLTLARGLPWEVVPDTPGVLLQARSGLGPTHVQVIRLTGATEPRACAEDHRTRLALAARVAGVALTDPTLSIHRVRGVDRPHVRYTAPLEARPGQRPAASMSRWTYYASTQGCVALGVTSVVRAKTDDAETPDPEDLTRLERVERVAQEGGIVTARAAVRSAP